MKTTILSIIIASLTLAAVGQVPTDRPTKYQAIRKMNVLAEKKRAFLALGHEERVNVWRDHFAHVLATEDLDADQREFLFRSLEALEAGELTDELDAEAKLLFDRELGRRVFNLGPFDCQAKNITREIRETTLKRGSGFAFASFSSPVTRHSSPIADCNCGQTSTNWGCDGSCDASNSCRKTPDGCSIFYMYPCDGKCSDPMID
jgi:hypothetical protein